MHNKNYLTFPHSITVLTYIHIYTYNVHTYLTYIEIHVKVYCIRFYAIIPNIEISHNGNDIFFIHLLIILPQALKTRLTKPSCVLVYETVNKILRCLNIDRQVDKRQCRV